MSRRKNTRQRREQNGSLIFSIIAIAIVIIIAIIFLSRPKKDVSVKIIKKVPAKKIAVGPRVAFVIDDWGYSLRNEKFITDKNLKFNLAILPNLSFSKKAAILANNNGKEVMLHLPMQPKNKLPSELENLTINPNMSSKEIKEILDKDLSNVPYVKGINNHMGSLATEHRQLMTIVFKELKNRKLFFLDSRTANKSVCRALAKKIGINFAERSVFLDNKNDPIYIKNQIKELIKIAKAKKIAIGIGHDRPKTLEAIKEMYPEIKKQGINIVFVSELFKK